jgi:3-hydroxybutyryl-CoA dehydrogenase
MSVKNVFVVGAGSMGNGIAQVCAQTGMSVTMLDLNDKILQKAMETVRWSVSKFAEKGKITESVETVMGRIKTTTDFKDCGAADLVIEVVLEKLEVKHDTFKKIDAAAKPGALLASNTSAIPITQIATVLSHPENFIGLHFFNPVPMMQAVEVIRGIATSDEAFAGGVAFVEAIGKDPIRVNRDTPGFLLNRINMMSNIEAMRQVEKGISTPDDIDKGMRLAFGRKMGPFETADLTGLDVQCMAYMNVYEEEKDNRYYPPEILRRKVLAGHLGRKTGKGWYEYNPDGTRKK